MAPHFEWAHTSEGPTLVNPADLTELADDGNPDGDHGLAWGECMIYGTPDQLRATLQAALDKLAGLNPLPALPTPADTEEEVEATCPYVYTQEDADRRKQQNREWNARLRELHGGAANVVDVDTYGVPEAGEVCGADLLLWDKDPVLRYLYTEGGKWIAGPSKLADDGGGDEEVNCSNMHYWSVPDVDEWQ